MNDQDSASIVITFLLLLPWLGRAAVSAMAVWRASHSFMHPTRYRWNFSVIFYGIIPSNISLDVALVP